MKKHLKRIMALVIAMVMCLGMTVMASAATITIKNNDPSTDENSTQEVYTAYKIFDAVKSTGTTVNTADSYTAGTLPQTLSEGGAITYTIKTNSPWFSKLFSESGTTATPVSGQSWFTATYISGSDFTESGTTYHTYQISPTANMTTEANAKSAAEWLLGVATATGSGITGTTLTGPGTDETSKDNTVDDGYYLVSSSLGANLGLATTDMTMTVVEKNQYPTIDKTQDDASTPTYADDAVDVQVGDTVYYQVVVFVPATANKDITVIDKMSTGLTPADASTITAAAGTYNTTSKVFTAADPAVALTKSTEGDWEAAAATSPNTYRITIHPTDNTKGKYIQFTFTATVDSDALTETDRENEVTLTYSNYTQTDSVEYDIYATGVVKYDGATATESKGVLTKTDSASAIEYLANAQFKLQKKVGTSGTWTDVAVSYNSTDGYYYPDASGSAVITSSDTAATKGQIIIRGLDNTTGSDSISYQLVETKAPDGYNLLTTPAALTLTKEEKTVETTTYNTTKVTQGTVDDSNTDTVALAATSVTKVANNKGTVLPSTGGMGTTIFYIIGAILVVGAGVVLITRRRMRAE